jgi:integrase
MNQQLALIIDQTQDTALISEALFGDGIQVAGAHGQTQQRTYVEQVQYWSEFTVMWLWHNDRLQSERSQGRYWDVWLDFFGYAERFETMPFETDVERARRIANIIDASPVKPWDVDARAANAYKVRLENRTHVTGRKERRGTRGKVLQPETRTERALSPKSIANAIAVLSSYYAKATTYPIYQGGVEAMLFDRVNPFSAVSRPKFEILFEREGMSPDETNRLLSAIPANTVQGAQHLALLMAYALTGRRNSEVRTAKFGDFKVDGDGRVWQTWRGKHHVEGKRDEVAPDVWTAITDYLQEAGRLETIGPDDYIFTALSDRAKRLGHGEWEPGNSPLSLSEVNRIFQMYLRSAKIKGHYCIHSLRHGLAEQMLEEGARIDEVQRQLGHRNVATTLIYTSRKVEGMSDAVARVGDKIGSHRILKNHEKAI